MRAGEPGPVFVLKVIRAEDAGDWREVTAG